MEIAAERQLPAALSTSSTQHQGPFMKLALVSDIQANQQARQRLPFEQLTG